MIETALSGLASQGAEALKIIPVPIGPGVLTSCSLDIGASKVATNGTYTKGLPSCPPDISCPLIYGDQTNSTCNIPKADGIVKNINWLNKNLLTCVKKQGARGTCHIFASISAMEELIARDSGKYVNLSEQDFNEFVKLGNTNPAWGWPTALYHAGGSVPADLNDAWNAQYQFAYENQWDYNPAYGSSDFNNTCQYYPYFEPGCSNSSPEAPEYCTLPSKCYYSAALLSGPRSPYCCPAAMNIWNSNPDTMVKNIKSQLAFGGKPAYGNAVVLGFKETYDFGHPTHGYVTYECSDAGGPGCPPGSPTPTGHGGHAVHVVGYIDNATLAANPATSGAPLGSGGGYFIIKNSWDTCKGDVGYYYMPVDYLKARATDVTAVQSFTFE